MSFPMHIENPQGTLRLCCFGGLTHSPETWKALRQALGDDYELVEFDYPEHGETEIAAGATVQAMVAQLSEQLARLPRKPVHLAGFSLGSWLAQGVALRLECPPQTLSLVGSALRIYEHGKSIVDEWIAALDSGGIDAAARGIFNWMFSSTTHEEIPKLKAYFMASMRRSGVSAQSLRHRMLAIRHFEEEFPVRNIDVPTLIIRGTDDYLFPAFSVRLLSRAMPRARLVEVAGAGHAVLMEKASRTIAELAAFMLGSGAGSEIARARGMS